MKCKFCDNDLVDITCSKHNNIIIVYNQKSLHYTFILDQSPNDAPIFDNNNYFIDFMFSNQVTEIHKGVSKDSLILKLNHIIDLHPDNARSYLNKILSLQAFL
jgi:hypothetical protein